nr:hypothetical protein CparaKRNrm1_p068 [Cryptomonas paramecium]
MLFNNSRNFYFRIKTLLDFNGKKKKFYLYENYTNKNSNHKNTFFFIPGYMLSNQKSDSRNRSSVLKKTNNFFLKKNTFKYFFLKKNIEVCKQDDCSKVISNPYVLYNFDKFMELNFFYLKYNSFSNTRNSFEVFQNNSYYYAVILKLFQKKSVFLISIFFIFKNFFSVEMLWDIFLLSSFFKLFFNLLAKIDLSRKKPFCQFFSQNNKIYTSSVFTIIWNSILRAGNLFAI